MKSFLILLIPLALAGSLLFGIRSCRQDNYAFCHRFNSAADYWIEFRPGEQAWLRRGLFGRWPLDVGENEANRLYDGESCTLRVVRVPLMDRRFLVFEAYTGGPTVRRILWELQPEGSLHRVSEMITRMEIGDRDEAEASKFLFQDVDGDGIDELRDGRRVWVGQGTEGDFCWICTWYAWNGTRFVRRYDELWPGGPLMDSHGVCVQYTVSSR